MTEMMTERPAAAQTSAPTILPDLFEIFADGAQRRRLMAEIAPVAVGFDLHWWRAEAEGDDAAERRLLAILRAADIGSPSRAPSISDELDRRLAQVPLPPRGYEPEMIENALVEAHEEWLEAPDDEYLARRCIRLRTLLGGISENVVASPIAEFPIVLEAPGDEGPSFEETAQFLVADARKLESEELDEGAVYATVDQLARANEFFGRLSPRRGERVPRGFRELRAAAREDEFDDLWPDLFEQRRRVLGALLRRLPVERDEDGRDWLEWALHPGDEEEKPAPAQPRSKRSLPRKLVAGVALGAGIFLLTLLPRSQPGALPAERLSENVRRPCTGCPAPERIEAVGFLSEDERHYVNVRLGAPPDRTDLRLQFAGYPYDIELTQRGDRWSGSIARGAGLDPADIAVGVDGDLVIVSLPPPFEANGVAVSSEAGDRVPDSGFVDVEGRPAPGVNLVDLAIVALLGFAAWRGYRRGLAASLPLLLGPILTLAVARLLYTWLGSALDTFLDTERQANAFALALLVTVVGVGAGIAGTLLGRRLTGAIEKRAAGPLERIAASRWDRWAGAPLGVLQTAVVVAMLIALVADLAALSRLGGSVQSSVLGRALIEGWRTFFPGV